jgi:HAD superfamily hydrolase (TIGR01509 family)
MIKLIIFDLDGVLVDSRELHYHSLNEALDSIDSKYVISRDEHLSMYDGLNTTKKLSLLVEKKGLPVELCNTVWERKQTNTVKLIDEFTIDERKIKILAKLKSEGYMICVASNSIRETVKMMLLRKGFMEYIDFFFSNQDVKNPKPSAEIFMSCMIKAGVSPKETLVIEDSHIGRKAALSSGAYLCPVINCEDVTYEKIKEHFEKQKEEVEKAKNQSTNTTKSEIARPNIKSDYSLKAPKK